MVRQIFFSSLVALAVLLAVFLTGSSANAASITYTPIQPPSYPLAVRNPYLSTWIPGPLVANLPTSSPQFWAGNSLTWSIIARVNGTAYNLFGVPNAVYGATSAAVETAEFTSTHSIFTLTAGSAKFTLDFFSPISPSNYNRQSLPFSYLTVSASSSSLTSVQIYSDIDDTWTGQSSNSAWGLETTGTTSVFSLNAVDAYTYSQNGNDQALWGNAIFASHPSAISNLTVQSGPQATVRGNFVGTGSLTGDVPSWTTGGVVGIAHDLGDVQSVVSVTYAVGYVREEAVNYVGTPYTGYYRATWADTLSAVSHFLDDYTDAVTEATTLDSDLSTKAIEVAGTNYSDIVVLSARQAYGGIDLVIPNESLNTDDVLGFIKEISSDGNVNTVDIIFPAFPIYYVQDPSYIRLLLDPILQYLAAGRWPLPYVIHDIGSAYPNATGHDDGVAEPMPIEETGNLLILAYAYTNVTGDNDWAEKYTPLLQGYADYLVEYSINIANQLSTNDAAGPLPNETNLAIKAAIGLKAFGELSGLANYSAVGEQHATLLYTDGLATDAYKTHFALEYPNNQTTWKVTFNLFADVLLKLNTFPSSAYTMDAAYYPTVRSAAGVALDNRQWWGKTDWNLWVAGTATAAGNIATQEMFVNDIWGFISNGLNSWPFSDRYVVSGSGGQPVGSEYALKARPTVGGHYALLALKGAKYLLSSAGYTD